MPRRAARMFAIVLSLVVSHVAGAAELKIATWNLDWLTDRPFGLPSDVTLRAPADFDRLRGYAGELNADVVAIEEVDGAAVARRLFPPERYSIHMSHDRVKQRVGIVVRRGLTYDVNPDVTAIALDPRQHLRSGVDITLHTAAGPLRMLALHLKRGCSYAQVGRSGGRTCRTLLAQFDVVTQWIAARRDEAAAFVVLGDFNRQMDRNDPFVQDLNSATPLLRATAGYSSPCWGRESFIDHILLGGKARDWVMPNSLRVLGYRETDPDLKDRLSDHCPVSVRLTLPE